MNGIKELSSVELDLISGGFINAMVGRVRRNSLRIEIMTSILFETMTGILDPFYGTTESNVGFLLTDKSFIVGSMIGGMMFAGSGISIIIAPAVCGLIGYRYDADRLLPNWLR